MWAWQEPCTLLSGPGWSEVIKGWLTVSTWNYSHWIMINPMECIIHLLHNRATCIAEGLFKTSYVFTIIHNMQFVVNVKHRKRRTTITLLFFLYLFREHCWSEFFLLLVSISWIPGSRFWFAVSGLQILDFRFHALVSALLSFIVDQTTMTRYKQKISLFCHKKKVRDNCKQATRSIIQANWGAVFHCDWPE